MAINLSAQFSHPDALYHIVRYARIDNTNTPTFTTVYPNPVNSPAVIAVGVPNGQYQIESTPQYADGRACDAFVTTTPACTGLTSLTGYIQGGNIIVQYNAYFELPKVRISVFYPNGGSDVQNYVNNGNNIVIPLPPNLYGDFSIQGQGVCDETSGFYSQFSPTVTLTNNANPTVSLISSTTGAVKTMIFQVGDAVGENNRYVFTVYSHDVTVTAAFGDTAANIVAKMVAAINATVPADWNDHGQAPATGTAGYPPTATGNSNQITIVLNSADTFAANAYTT